MISLTMVLAAFCGGVFGSAIGALPAFIFVGFTGIVGVAVQLAGGPPTILNDVAFGNLFGPHISFGPAVAATAFAASRRKKIHSGLDIVVPLIKTNDISVLLVGGLFGIMGYILNTYFSAIKLPTDTIALTVIIIGVIARLIFGSTGLTGSFDKVSGEKRKFISNPNMFAFNGLIAFAIAFGVANVVHATQISVIGFAISALSLVFLQMGFAFPVTHHITMTTGYATMASGNIYVGALFGLLAYIVEDIICKTINSYCDTHIDPPAAAIFICAFIIFIFL